MTFPDLMIAAGVLLVTTLIYYYVFRWIFSVKQQLENQDRQIELLQEIIQKLEK